MCLVLSTDPVLVSCLRLQLKHPNIVALIDVETTATKLKLVFEFLEYDLKKYMTKYGRIPPEDVKSFAYQTLCGIAHCHAHRHLVSERRVSLCA